MKKVADILNHEISELRTEGGRHGVQNEQYTKVVEELLRQEGLLETIVLDSPIFYEILRQVVHNLRVKHGFEWIAGESNPQPKTIEQLASENLTEPSYLDLVQHIRSNAENAISRHVSQSVFSQSAARATPIPPFVLHDRFGDNQVTSIKRITTDTEVSYEVHGTNCHGEPRFIRVTTGGIYGFDGTTKLGVVGRQMRDNLPAIFAHFGEELPSTMDFEHSGTLDFVAAIFK